MTAAEILRLIETVSPDDEIGMHNIDTKVWLYLTRPNSPVAIPSHPKYTRSRDALKSVRPEGWLVQELSQDYATGTWYCTLVSPKYGGENAVQAGEQYTETLAELSAIIQAIEHERTTTKEN